MLFVYFSDSMVSWMHNMTGDVSEKGQKTFFLSSTCENTSKKVGQIKIWTSGYIIQWKKIQIWHNILQQHCGNSMKYIYKCTIYRYCGYITNCKERMFKKCFSLLLKVHYKKSNYIHVLCISTFHSVWMS